MILNFPGGVAPLERTHFGKSNIKVVDSCSAVCLSADGDASVSAPVDCRVVRGTLLGESGGVPVYSSIAGVFRGILEIEQKRYFVVMNDGENGTEAPLPPEENALNEMTAEYIVERARLLSVTDSRSGLSLWELLVRANGKCKRLVIDCTESDASSAINYRLCIEKTKSLVGGAKVLLKATGALKCVFAAEYYRNAAFEAIGKQTTDEKLFALAQLEEKYPYGDRAIMEALYLKTLERGKTALDEGVFIVAPETAVALYDAMVSGMPQLDRYITVCGDGIASGGNLRLPKGITLHDVSEICGGVSKDFTLVENSLLSGTPLKGALSDGTRTLIAAKMQKKNRTPCISCGSCVEVCPVRLMPCEILAGEHEALKTYCISCGACEFICPSGIPLLKLIQKPLPNKEAQR